MGGVLGRGTIAGTDGNTGKAYTWYITTSYEDAWSATKGYPKSVCFYENRLWFGGSKSYPTSIWASKANLFFDFAAEEVYDGSSLDISIESEQINEIINIFSQRNLQIFTSGSEFYIPQSFNEPITPTNISIRRQTNVGSWGKTKPVDVDGRVFFIEKNGKMLTRFVFDDTQQAYITSAQSLLSSHIILNPVGMDVEKNTISQQSNYIYIINSDGTLCQGNILDEQEINGYSLWTTLGDYKDIAVNYEGVYFIISRFIDGEQRLFLEKQVDKNTDCNYYDDDLYAPVSSIGGLDHLEGETVDVIADGVYVGQKTVASGGVILGTTASQSVEIGLPYTIQVRSNPVEIINLGVGVGKNKRIAEMTCRLYNTENLLVNGEEATLTTEDEQDYTFFGIGDWGEKESWEITQNKPYPLTILGIQMNVNYEVANG